MKSKVSLVLLMVMIIAVFYSCENDDDRVILALNNGQSISVRNTLQIEADASQGGTGGIEVPVEVVFNAPEGFYNIDSIVSNDIEFDNYLEGLYDIDFSINSVTFTLVAMANDPIYENFFRIIEPNTFDRYYFTFDGGHRIETSSSSDSSVKLKVLSENEIVIEIGEGWNFNPGSTFTITFN